MKYLIGFVLGILVTVAFFLTGPFYCDTSNARATEYRWQLQDKAIIIVGHTPGKDSPLDYEWMSGPEDGGYIWSAVFRVNKEDTKRLIKVMEETIHKKVKICGSH